MCSTVASNSARAAASFASGRNVDSPSAKDATKAEPYAVQTVAITLGAKEKRNVMIRTSFKPEKVVVDPNVRVLQLRRESAEAKL